MILNTVVLPAPLGPIIPTRSCVPICKSNAETAVRPPNLTLHCWRLRSAPAMSILGGVRRQFRSLDPGAADWDSSSRQPAEEPLRTQQHQRDQDEGINDDAIRRNAPDDFRQPLVPRNKTQIFQQQRQQNCGEGHTDCAAHSAENDHNHNLDGSLEIESAWIDVRCAVGVKTTGNACKKSAEP